MSDTETAAAAATAVPDAGGDTGGFTVPDGQELISRDELANLRSSAGRLPEMQRFYETARKAGFNDPSGFEKYSQHSAALQKRGLTLDQVVSLLDQDMDAGQGGGGEQPAFDPEAYKAELKAELAKDSATASHKSQLEQHLKALDKLDYLELGEDVSDDDRKMWSTLARGLYHQSRDLYPEDHPLHQDDLAPLAEELLAERVHGPLKEFMSRLSGAQLAKIGKAATGTKTSGAAAKGGTKDGSGEPEPPPSNLKDAIARKIK